MPAVPIKLPKSESVFQGTVARWLKADGDLVKVGEKLLEFETDKTMLEIVATEAGRLKIQTPEGTTIGIEDSPGAIDTDAASEAKAKSEPAKAEASKAQSPAPSTAAPAAAAKTQDQPSPASTGAASPAGRRLAAESGVDLGSVAGTGRGGVVLKEDVQTHLEKGSASAPAPIPESPRLPSLAASAPSANGGLESSKPRRETRERMTGIRQKIAQRLVEAQHTAAILTTFNEVDMSRVMELRGKYKDAFKTKHGVNLGFMSFFLKAAVEALRTFPKVNGRIEGSEVVLNHYYDIGVAVSTERGLMVPVVRDADRKSFAELEKEIVNYAVKARDGKMDVADLQGGTFTITNGGVFGSLLSTPILNPPQSGILGMHAIKERPIALNGQVVIRPMMYLALSYDHRIIDGREAVSFLVRVKDLIEDPERLLLEI